MTEGRPAAPVDVPGGPDRWDAAPCGLLRLSSDGVVLDANAQLLAWAGRTYDDVVARARLPELLTVGGRIYWETHLAPLLAVEGRVEEIAVELRDSRGERLPVLLTAVRRPDGDVDVALSGAQERSRYERQVQAARDAAVQAAGSLRRLQEATAALSEALDVDAVCDALLASARDAGAAGAAVRLAGREHRDDAVRAVGVPVPPDVRAAEDAPDGGVVVVPLPGRGGSHGVLALVPSTAPAAEPLDLPTLAAIGRQAGLALDRAEAYETTAVVASELQHALLTTELPQDPRAVVAATYRPGVEALDVGGDWYDAFLTAHDTLAVVVGDVVGRGLGAATAMGQLRSAVRALAHPDLSPAQLLERLDDFALRIEAAFMATVVVGELDLATGRVRYACAGHLPPVHVPADGPARLLWEGRSTPLGVQRGGRSDAVVDLVPGDRLLLYTDGLVERRDRTLDDGLDGLLAQEGTLRRASLQDALAVLERDLLCDEAGRDDVCTLLLERPAT